MTREANETRRSAESNCVLPNKIAVTDLYRLTPAQRENCELIASGLVTVNEIRTARYVSKETTRRQFALLRDLVIDISGKFDQEGWGTFRVITEMFRTGIFLQLPNTLSIGKATIKHYMWGKYCIDQKKNILPFDLAISEGSNLTPILRENLRLMLQGFTSDEQLSNIRGVSINTIGKEINGGPRTNTSMHNKVAKLTNRSQHERIERPKMLIDLIRTGDIEQVINLNI